MDANETKVENEWEDDGEHRGSRTREGSGEKEMKPRGFKGRPRIIGSSGEVGRVL